MNRSARIKRHSRVRRFLSGSPKRPRLSVFRSSQHIYAQLIDDSKGVTLVAESDLKIKGKSKKDKAFEVGKKIAQKATRKGITQVLFDRGGFLYHGRVRALADGAREGGLKF